MDKDSIYIGGLFQPKKQLYSRAAESPVFVPLEGVSFEGPDTDEEHCGRMIIKRLDGEPLKGYRCNEIYSWFMWEPNGPNKGYSHILVCIFSGSEPNFNHMMRLMLNFEKEYIILLPRKDKPYLVFGNKMYDIEIEIKSSGSKSFTLMHNVNYVPFAYYEGELQVVDCTEPELMKALYKVKE